jgi:hypothetical protein
MQSGFKGLLTMSKSTANTARGSITAVAKNTGDLNPTNQAASIRPLDEQQHDTPRQLGERWGLSSDSIRDLFKDEDGILLIVRKETMHKRPYTTMRIPRSVSHRVHCRLQSKK